MSIRSVKDIVDAHSEGRVHLQRFFKNASTTGDTHWLDWSFASGQPAYDARIGDALTFTPLVAAGNDAIWFPGKSSSHQRVLTDITLRTLAGGTNQASVDCVLYDLVGVYPLIDGDSTDPQEMDNTLTLPRYTDGSGVFPVIVNHVAPIVSAANGTMVYVDHNGVEQTSSFRVMATGANKVVSGVSGAGATGVGSLSMPLIAGSRGARQIKSITFSAAPGGLFAIYMIKPLTTITNNDGAIVADKIATEKSLILNHGFSCPEIKDGAWLGFFIRPNGGSRSVSMFGHLTFVWG